MFISKGVSLPVKMLVTLSTLLIAGCSSATGTQPLATPTVETVSQATEEAAPSSPMDAAPLPTREPIPEGLVQIPVPASAQFTAGELATADHPPTDRYRLARELRGMSGADLQPDTQGKVEYEVNDRTEFILNKNLSGDYQKLPSRLRYISDNAYWWTSHNARAEDDEIIAAAQRFEDEILKINRLIFGQEWTPGIDNDPRIHILMVEEIRWGGTFGYYSNINEYPVSIEPNSNEKEIIFVNLGAVAIDSAKFGGELAHEYHHLIHWNQDPNEDLWWNEAMSELAIFLSGAPPSTTRGKNNADLFAEFPDIQLTSRPELRFGDEDLSRYAHYAAERLFAVYLLEQYGPQLIKDIVANPAPGVLGIREELARLPDSPTFEEVYSNWILANLLNRTGLEEGQYGYEEVTPVPPQLELVQTFDGEIITDKLPPYGTRYYEVRREEPVQVSFKGSTLARLTPVDPPSGEYAWYSNRGDDTEFTLTRAFDLSGLDSATLNFKAWHELEDYYDFAYVEVSTNGGETWQILETANGTDNNPNGQNLGFGYTGTTLEWLSESIDLTPYTGQEVLIRFHVVTDFTTNRDGFQVDDIEIPELGYVESAEDDSGGWEAKGFIRSSNFVPVEWIVYLVKASNPIQVERITLTAEQAAEFEIAEMGQGYNLAAVVVSPTAPVTTQSLDYELQFQGP